MSLMTLAIIFGWSIAAGALAALANVAERGHNGDSATAFIVGHFVTLAVLALAWYVGWGM